ncbi:protein shisa-4 isoform X3 [Mustelus asterias]
MGCTPNLTGTSPFTTAFAYPYSARSRHALQKSNSGAPVSEEFCCGNCTSRYCCLNPMQLISERQQNYCMSLNLSSFTTIAGIVSAVLLLIVIIGILVCCFLCSCCYLYQRRHQMRQPVSGGREAIHSFPMQPTNPPNVSPGAYTSYQTAPAYGVAGAQGMFPNYPIQAGYPAYMPPASHAPYTSAPAYNAAPAPPYPSS